MADEPFYSPHAKPSPPRVPKPGEVLWTLHKDHIIWSCELRFHGESSGWEAQILRMAISFSARTFQLREVTLAWAASERTDIERGWTA